MQKKQAEDLEIPNPDPDQEPSSAPTHNHVPIYTSACPDTWLSSEQPQGEGLLAPVLERVPMLVCVWKIIADYVQEPALLTQKCLLPLSHIVRNFR